MKVIALVPAAGMGKRMGAEINKQYLLLAGKPIVAHTLQVLEDAPFIDDIHVIVPEAEIPYCREHVVERYGFTKVRGIVAGGPERQHSVMNGLRKLTGMDDDDVILIHDGVRPFISLSILEKSVETARKWDGALVAVPVKDTVKIVENGVVRETPARETLWLAQTPQAFRYSIIMAAHEIAAAERYLGTDDASLVEWMGKDVHIVLGDYRNIKITTPEDLVLAEAFLAEARLKTDDCRTNFERQQIMERNDMRIGHGYDVHRLVEGRKLILGGVDIPYEKGLLGHSDADVLLHAISDAILGAIGEGDIGRHFPDTDPRYKGADSLKLLAHVMKLAEEKGFMLGNVDATIVAQRPKLAPHIPLMRENIAGVLSAGIDRVNVKATTTEELGFAGRGEGIAAYAVALLKEQ
jgi:2-C-methyl-D-erythritol 4-phosphate cytidylyltransferase/2-C-methyl-D-erythritol 2,4-cyclodiphosphate synthase